MSKKQPIIKYENFVTNLAKAIINYADENNLSVYDEVQRHMSVVTKDILMEILELRANSLKEDVYRIEEKIRSIT